MALLAVEGVPRRCRRTLGAAWCGLFALRCSCNHLTSFAGAWGSFTRILEEARRPSPQPSRMQVHRHLYSVAGRVRVPWQNVTIHSSSSSSAATSQIHGKLQLRSSRSLLRIPWHGGRIHILLEFTSRFVLLPSCTSAFPPSALPLAFFLSLVRSTLLLALGKASSHIHPLLPSSSMLLQPFPHLPYLSACDVRRVAKRSSDRLAGLVCGSCRASSDVVAGGQFESPSSTPPVIQHRRSNTVTAAGLVSGIRIVLRQVLVIDRPSHVLRAWCCCMCHTCCWDFSRLC